MNLKKDSLSSTTQSSLIRTRFAPTPSGYLHLGNAFSFVITWLLARRHGGKILLRIDDLDSSRKRPEFVEDIFQSLEWLGLDYDEGPVGPTDFDRNWSQTVRTANYHAALEKLADSNLVFGCACTRSTIREQTSDGRHPAVCAEQNLGRADLLEQTGLAWRLHTASIKTRIKWRDRPLISADSQGNKLQSVDLHEAMRDVVLRKKDGNASYQIASLLDDSNFNMNLVVRGKDLVDSTAVQLWLADRLNITAFQQSQFVHHELISGSRWRQTLEVGGLNFPQSDA